MFIVVRKMIADELYVKAVGCCAYSFTVKVVNTSARIVHITVKDVKRV
jgi:hypothetical protein